MRTSHDDPFLYPIANQLLNFRKSQGASGPYRSMASQRGQHRLNPHRQRRRAIPLRDVIEQILHQDRGIHLAKPNRHPANCHSRGAKWFNQKAEFLQLITVFK